MRNMSAVMGVGSELAYHRARIAAEHGRVSTEAREPSRVPTGALPARTTGVTPMAVSKTTVNGKATKKHVPPPPPPRRAKAAPPPEPEDTEAEELDDESAPRASGYYAQRKTLGMVGFINLRVGRALKRVESYLGEMNRVGHPAAESAMASLSEAVEALARARTFLDRVPADAPIAGKRSARASSELVSGATVALKGTAAVRKNYDGLLEPDEMNGMELVAVKPGGKWASVKLESGEVLHIRTKHLVTAG